MGMDTTATPPSPFLQRPCTSKRCRLLLLHKQNGKKVGSEAKYLCCKVVIFRSPSSVSTSSIECITLLHPVYHPPPSKQFFLADFPTALCGFDLIVIFFSLREFLPLSFMKAKNVEKKIFAEHKE